MKSKQQRINEIENSPEYNNWRYDRNKLRDLLDAVWREGMSDAADICAGVWYAKHAREEIIAKCELT